MKESNGEGIKEKNLVKNLKGLFEDRKLRSLKKVFVHVNLGTKKFQEIWKEWWQSEVPPRLEVDMILVFENLNELLISGIEVKFFKGEERKFYEGLQQALSIGLFGFDSLVLWHIFSEDIANKEIEGFVRPTKKLIEGFNLPVVYFATKLIEKDKFEFFAPLEIYSSQPQDVDYLLTWLRNSCHGKRNPLLEREEVLRSKKLLKIKLEIPI